MSINRVSISGNLTRDPELRQTAGNGTQVLNLGVAVNDRRRNNQTGQWEDYPNFIDCVLFGNRAGNLAQYLHKGSKVAIAGKLRYSSWEKDGQRRSKVEVVIDDIEFMDGRQNQQPQQPPQMAAPQYQQPPQMGAPQYQGPSQQDLYEMDMSF